ncbi:FMN-binding protein [Nocardioides aromaticivorans]|uniref:FMN-binding protein n=1 Tax=Nocardioides aromaticivorans TaxID=200618 RepID=A0ABX7PG56_9ACTN|nr:FMN-binding protein [Nocardioides aromaticivorans]QSR24906.1 FMN-binding protein [Nocardioides aromaticivorans]
MRRIALWAASTVSVLVLLFGYHTSTSGPEATTAAPPVSGSLPVSGTSGSSGSSGSSGTSGSSGSASGATTTGDSVDTRWGPVQVAITVEDGTITAVDVPVYPTGNPKDQQINSYALPILVQETLDAQSASIDMVSGATVTSVGYQQSLQSALDQAGL